MSDGTREVVLTVRQWQAIDAELDASGHTAVVVGDDATARTARRLREYGWHLSRSHCRALQGELGWPPADALFLVRLDEDDWAFVRGCLQQARDADPSPEQVLVEDVLATVG